MWIISQYQCFKTQLFHMYLRYRKASVNSYLRMPQRSVLMPYGILFLNRLINNIIPEPRSPVISSAASYSGDPEFKVRPTGGVLSQYFFRDFP